MKKIKLLLKRIKQFNTKWFYCDECDMVVPQLSIHHKRCLCSCIVGNHEMKRYRESDKVIQNNWFYKKINEGDV